MHVGAIHLTPLGATDAGGRAAVGQARNVTDARKMSGHDFQELCFDEAQTIRMA
jgi:hypothetical protein